MIRIKYLTFLLGCLWCGLVVSPVRAQSNNTVRQLLEVQQQVQDVVSRNMNSVVSVSDGVGFGSGVVVSEDGLILTAGHVMSTRKEYEVLFPNGQTARARPLGKNLNVDAGMIQIIEPGPWPAVKISQQPVELGDWVVNIGHSGGFELGRKPPVRAGKYIRRRNHQLVTDAVLIGGDSGGPLFNLKGELVAIHSSIGDSIAENRHVDIAFFRQHWDRMKSGDSWGSLPALGGAGKSVKNKARMGVTVDRKNNNARILKVRPGSPADQVGIQEGDVVIEFDGAPIKNSTQLIDKIKAKRPGDQCMVTVNRNGGVYRFLINLRTANR